MHVSTADNAIAKQFQPPMAYEFLARYKPQTLEFLLELNIAFQEDEQKAAAIAAQYCEKPASVGRYPAAIWERVFQSRR